MDENVQAKFEERLKELLNVAKKKKNVLEYQEISEFFHDITLEEEQFDRILETLEQNNVDVLRITDGDDVDDEEIILTEEDDVDVENIDLSVPDGVSKRKLNWRRGWKWETRKRRRNSRRRICVLLSALQNDMWAAVCFFWI